VGVGVIADRGRRSLSQIVALAVAALFLLPLVLLVAGSLREVGPAAPVPDLLPARPTLENYGRAFELVDLARQAWNSTLVALIVVPLSVAVAAAAGFAIARLPTIPRRAMVSVSLAATMIPLSMLIVGRFTVFRSLGLTDSYVPLIATALIGGSSFNVLLFYVAFRHMPSELFDAARLEGASAVRMLLQVGLPGARNVTLAVAVLAFAASWGNVLEPLVYLSDEDLYTLPLGLRSLATLDLPNQPIMLAGAVLSFIVPLALLLVAYRRFTADRPELG
jgi:multiple sugar transport system permease protein